MSGTIHLVATLVAKLGQETALEAALTGILSDVRAEPGCLRYDLHRDREDPARFVMLEAWSDAAALEAHGRAAPFTALAARFDDLLASPPDLRRLEHLA
ncbi:putative quinol monooxygenase [Geminicoccus roseus]|uniref:putative quinol monooxygenase n=1 Tax=Geminicoccus roseus TaxID=404900 RepID=UPI0004276721|nr:putative quinol monooxygenase [Geminicoccus roseus]